MCTYVAIVMLTPSCRPSAYRRCSPRLPSGAVAQLRQTLRFERYAVKGGRAAPAGRRLREEAVRGHVGGVEGEVADTPPVLSVEGRVKGVRRADPGDPEPDVVAADHETTRPVGGAARDDRGDLGLALRGHLQCELCPRAVVQPDQETTAVMRPEQSRAHPGTELEVALRAGEQVGCVERLRRALRIDEQVRVRTGVDHETVVRGE